jgi:hypothetical protein
MMVLLVGLSPAPTLAVEARLELVADTRRRNWRATTPNCLPRTSAPGNPDSLSALPLADPDPIAR